MPDYELAEFESTDSEQPADRPDACECSESALEVDHGLPCWPCYRDGHETSNPAPLEVERMPADPTAVERVQIYDYPGDSSDTEIFERLEQPGEPTIPVTVDLPVADMKFLFKIRDHWES